MKESRMQIHRNETRRFKKKKKKKRMATKTVKSTKNKNARDESVQKTWIQREKNFESVELGIVGGEG